jgi:hypothetical protein
MCHGWRKGAKITRMNLTKSAKKIASVMREHKAGKLKSSSGQKVKSRDQAVAIALSEAERAKKGKK